MLKSSRLTRASSEVDPFDCLVSFPLRTSCYRLHLDWATRSVLLRYRNRFPNVNPKLRRPVILEQENEQTHESDLGGLQAIQQGVHLITSLLLERRMMKTWKRLGRSLEGLPVKTI